MSAQPVLPRWSIIAPILGWAVLASSHVALPFDVDQDIMLTQVHR